MNSPNSEKYSIRTRHVSKLVLKLLVCTLIDVDGSFKKPERHMLIQTMSRRMVGACQFSQVLGFTFRLEVPLLTYSWRRTVPSLTWQDIQTKEWLQPACPHPTAPRWGSGQPQPRPLTCLLQLDLQSPKGTFTLLVSAGEGGLWQHLSWLQFLPLS